MAQRAGVCIALDEECVPVRPDAIIGEVLAEPEGMVLLPTWEER